MNQSPPHEPELGDSAEPAPDTESDAAFWRRSLAAVVGDEKAWQAELTRRKATIEAQSEQLAAAARDHAALEAVRKLLADHAAGLEGAVADREREIRRLFGEASEAHRLLQETWSSRSWRMTTPVRSIGIRLRRLRSGRTPPPEPAPQPEPAPPAVEAPPPAAETGPPPLAAGDHVLLTDATPDNDHLLSLIGRGVGFSLVLHGAAPLEPEAPWLRTALMHARRIFVSNEDVRDRVLRWAVLSDVYVSATVSIGEPDAMAEPAAPLGQPGRCFLPGIVAPEMLPTLELAQAWCTEDNPQVSIVVIDRDAAPLTRACIQHIWAHTSGIRYEIVVAGAGGGPAASRAVGQMGRGVRLVPVGADRFFGEACNVVAEQAQAPLLCFVHNDCFVQPGWLQILAATLAADPAVGAAGPLLLYPNLSAREAGGTINAQGVPAPFTGRDTAQPADYVSAAAMLVRRDAFLRAGGFDLMYEPELFEDVDLCFKLQALGFSVRSCPAARIIHAEADRDDAAQVQREALADLNRTKFVSRWGAFLRSRSAADLLAIKREAMVEPPAAPAGEASRRTAALYTPYAITPGGGERYLLTMASELTRDHQVTIVTPNPYSQLRLQNIAHIFGIDLSRCGTQTAEAFAAAPAPDLMVVLGNYIYPPIEPRTPNAVFICQFPFPMVGYPRRIDEGYRAVIAYSDYARHHIEANQAAHDMPRWPVEIVYPPVPQVAADLTRKRPMVLTVGRFFTSGHNKRHDLMIDAFRRVLDAQGSEGGGEVEMHLAGSSTPGAEHMRYLDGLMRAAEGMPVSFHVNASRETLEDLYRRASVYWHATGLGGDVANHPELAEHFGISLVEAMSAGCVPLAFDAGGPREIITPGVDGFLYGSLDELVTLTSDLLHPDAAARREQIGRAASERARAFAPERFGARVRDVLLAG